MLYFHKFLPSSKVKNDIKINYNPLSTIKPINIKNISLISPIKKQILHIRQQNSTLNLYQEDKFLSLIVPYRHREEHLKIFLPAITNYLNKQKIKHEIIIVEQDDKLPFNRAKLMNVGVAHADIKSQYFVFHDVDLIPQNINYKFKNQTVKLFNFIETNNINKEYGETIFGGVTLVPKEIFYTINGFSNNYWQWGKEDDDFLMRHLFKGFIPFLDKNGKFIALEHQESLKCDVDGKYKENKDLLKRNKLFYKKNKHHFSNFKRGLFSQDNDGINSLENFTINSIKIDKTIKTIKVSFTIETL